MLEKDTEQFYVKYVVNCIRKSWKLMATKYAVCDSGVYGL